MTSFCRHSDQVRPYVPRHPHNRLDNSTLPKLDGGKSAMTGPLVDNNWLPLAYMKHSDSGIGRNKISDGLDLLQHLFIYLGSNRDQHSFEVTSAADAVNKSLDIIAQKQRWNPAVIRSAGGHRRRYDASHCVAMMGRENHQVATVP